MLALLLAALSLGGPQPTRADLAAAYVRFERALRDHPPGESARVEIESGFDAATLSFFTGDGARALARIDELTARLDPARTEHPAERTADALALDVDRREVVSGTGGTLGLRLRALRDLPAGPTGAESAVVRLVMPTAQGRRVLATCAIPIPAGADSAPSAASVRVPGGGEYPAARIDLDVELEVPGARPRRVGSVALVGTPLADVRRGVEARLARVQPDGPPLEYALGACRARAALLDAAPSGTDSTRFLLDLAAHAAAVEDEVAALEHGTDPYRRRPGDLWRVVSVQGKPDLPLRVYAPDAACGDTRVPLVLALHGAGGDENMFFTAYGSGRLRALADQHGFVAACPRLGFGGLTAQSFDALVEALVYTYPIDRRRIHVVGHSLGAGAAGSLRLARGTGIASTALLSGPPRAGGGPGAPPVFLAGGALDSLASADSLRRAGDLVRSEGAEIEVCILPGRGHTLFVGDVLPAAIAWCLARSRR